MLRYLVLIALLFLPETCAGQSSTLTKQLTQPFPKLFPELYGWTDTCNVWVLRDGSKALLIDFGNGSVMTALHDTGITEIDRVLLTHHHREQFQGLLLPDVPRPPVYVPAEERRLFESPRSFRHWFPSLGDEYSVYGASYVRPAARALVPADVLSDGQIIRWGRFEIRCVSTPGNSPGSISFLIASGGQRFAFTGDLIHDGARMVTWYDSEWDYGFGKGIDTLLNSVSRLQIARSDILLPAHGGVIRNASSQLTQYQRKLVDFRAAYVRGYPVFDSAPEDRDSLSVPTKVPLVSRVTPHVYKLSHQTQGKNFAMIVSDSGKGLILDCGLMPESMLEEIIVGMRTHLGLRDIDAFWISHMHGDHFLMGPVLREKYGAESWTLDMIADRCENPRRYDYAALVSAYGDGFDGMPVDRSIRRGERIEWEGYTLQVDWMPGQTEFGCCLWLEIDGQKIAFTGDNLFGNPRAPEQDGHEAVVARNSCIFEEGYRYAARYLKDLQPDILIGGHSWVMQSPQAFIERYLHWSESMITLYTELLPGDGYEYGFDPYWVSAYPYRVDLAQQSEAEVTISIRNFRTQHQNYRVVLQLPQGVSADRRVLQGITAPNARSQEKIRLRRTTDSEDPENRAPEIVPLDITLDGRKYGQQFDFILRRTADTRDGM